MSSTAEPTSDVTKIVPNAEVPLQPADDVNSGYVEPAVGSRAS